MHAPRAGPEKVPRIDRVLVRMTPSLAIGGSAHSQPITSRTGNTLIFSCELRSPVDIAGLHRGDIAITMPISNPEGGKAGTCGFSGICSRTAFTVPFNLMQRSGFSWGDFPGRRERLGILARRFRAQAGGAGLGAADASTIGGATSSAK